MESKKIWNSQLNLRDFNRQLNLIDQFIDFDWWCACSKPHKKFPNLAVRVFIETFQEQSAVPTHRVHRIFS